MDSGSEPDEEARGPFDEVTLRKVRDRDPAAMNRFFEAFFDRVYSYVARLLRDETTAEDLTQESFLRMHGAIDRLDPSRDPTPWVFTIVTNVVRDFWRSRAYKTAAKHVSLDDAWELPSENHREAPDKTLEIKETAYAVQRAMAELSPADREILLLRSFRNLATAEVVEILGISPEAARQRYSRAVRRLKVAYEDLMGSDWVSA